MIVKVSEIPTGGREVEFDVGPELFGGGQAGKGADAARAHGAGSEKPGSGIRQLTPAQGHEDEAYPGIRLIGNAHARFWVGIKGCVILIDGELDAEIGLECSRCGRKFEMPVSEKVRVDLAPPNLFGDEADIELHPEDLDIGLYDGEKIDLSVVLREQLLLQLPMQPLCSEDCKGLCQLCGKDLNKGDCNCSKPAGHVGLNGLKDLLDSMEKGESKDG
jgi:uncharacterized protein